MTKIGRNDLCPCDSGRKYKRCCLPLHKHARSAQRVPMPMEKLDEHLDHLDELSNRVADLLSQDRYEDAEQVALQLMDEYAEDPQGLERLAQVYDAWGKKDEAARAFRQAAAFHEVVLRMNPMTAAWLRDQADRMDQGLDMEWPDGDLDGPDNDV